jgi:hypothetical protein
MELQHVAQEEDAQQIFFFLKGKYFFFLCHQVSKDWTTLNQMDAMVCTVCVCVCVCVCVRARDVGGLVSAML